MRSDWWDKPLAHLVMHVNGGEKTVPIFDQLFVGRQCAGIDEQRRLVIPDPNISRNHLEIRLDVETDRAFLIDNSTNGTLLNGMPLERAVQVSLKPDDRISMGDVVLIFRSDRFNAAGMTHTSPTLTRIVEETMVMVVGDITNYSTISEVTDNRVIAQSLNYLWHELNRVLRAHPARSTITPAMHCMRSGNSGRFQRPMSSRSTLRSLRTAGSRNSRPRSRYAGRTARRSGWAGVWCRAGPRSPQ